LRIGKKLPGYQPHDHARAADRDEDRAEVPPLFQSADAAGGECEAERKKHQSLTHIAEHDAEQQREEKSDDGRRIDRAVEGRAVTEYHALETLDEWSVAVLHGNLFFAIPDRGHLGGRIQPDGDAAAGQFVEILHDGGRIARRDPAGQTVDQLRGFETPTHVQHLGTEGKGLEQRTEESCMRFGKTGTLERDSGKGGGGIGNLAGEPRKDFVGDALETLRNFQGNEAEPLQFGIEGKPALFGCGRKNPGIVLAESHDDRPFADGKLEFVEDGGIDPAYAEGQEGQVFDFAVGDFQVCEGTRLVMGGGHPCEPLRGFVLATPHVGDGRQQPFGCYGVGIAGQRRSGGKIVGIRKGEPDPAGLQTVKHVPGRVGVGTRGCVLIFLDLEIRVFAQIFQDTVDIATQYHQLYELHLGGLKHTVPPP